MIDLDALTQAVGELDEERTDALLNEFVAQNPPIDETQQVVAACQQGMGIVGDNYEKGDYFVGDLIFAGELLTNSIAKLKPLLGNDSGSVRGVIVLGTVQGDIHDIGKNVFKSMAEASGFSVIDLGIDVPADDFVAAVKENKPDVVGLSGVLTVAIDSMKQTIELLQKEGLRDRVKVTIGGVAVSEEVCKHVGADAWSKNAAETVKVCGAWVS